MGPPELVLVPLPASVGKFNCLFHPFLGGFFVWGVRERRGEGEKFTHAGQKAEVNKAAPEQVIHIKTSKRSPGKHEGSLV